MCVAVGCRTVGGPAGVTNADVGRRKRVSLDLSDQIIELSSLFAGFEQPIGDYRNTCRIVSPVFKSTKPADQYLEG